MATASPIAVIAMSGIFPGSPSIDTFWKHLLDRKNAIIDIPQERWIRDASHVLRDRWEPDSALTRRAGLITAFSFDPSGFDIDPDLVSAIDPLYQLVLSAGKTALSGFRLTPEIRRKAGVMLAAIALPTDQAGRLTRTLFETLPIHGLAAATPVFPSLSPTDALGCRVTGLPAALLAGAFGLEGGSLTLDAACASSLYAIKLACDALSDGQLDLVVAGGVSRPDCLFTQIGFTQLRALSPSGRCAPFDADADGLVVGEGVGLLVLKRLEDALANGDPIHAVIRGIGVSNDIRGNLLAPDSEGQLRAMAMAYENAGWDPSDVDLIECHGAGTPVGDAVELTSLCSLWQNVAAWTPGQCAIGSVKSMIGHLLTAAGAAGLIKTILGLTHRIIPPSLNFTHAHPKSPLHGSPFRVQTTPEAWPEPTRRPGLRRAAVSAFGFGGINAHILLEEWRDPVKKPNGFQRPKSQSPPQKMPEEPIAIIGMAATIGELETLSDFESAIFEGRIPDRPRPAHRWRGIEAVLPEALQTIGRIGRYIDTVDVRAAAFHIPPNELPDLLPQQILLLKTADAARRHAGFKADAPDTRAGVVIGINFDIDATRYHLRWNVENRPGADALSEAAISRIKDALCPPLTASRTLGSLGSIVASRVAREFRMGGPGITVSDGPNSGLKALAIAVQALRKNELDTVFAGAVDLSGDVRLVLSQNAERPYSTTSDVHPFDENADGPVPGEGAVVLVLKRLSDAMANQDTIHGVIRGFGEAGGGRPLGAADPERYRRSLTQALEASGRSADQVSYMEAAGSAHPEADAAEAQALCATFTALPAVALGTRTSVTGATGAVSGLAGVVKTALCLSHRVLPPIAGFAKAIPTLSQGKSLHPPIRPRFWAVDKPQTPRTAVVGSWSEDFNACHVVLEEAMAHENGQYASHHTPVGIRLPRLFRVTGETVTDLLNRLETAHQALSHEPIAWDGISRHATEWTGKDLPEPNRHRVTFLIQSPEEVTDILQQAMALVSQGRHALLSQTSNVSYVPEAPDGQVAFVYPGAGNHYIDMGRELGLAFPQVLNELNDATDHFKQQSLPHVFIPDGMDWTSGWQAQALRTIHADPRQVIFGQVVFALVTTAILRKAGIRPQAAIGYSLGESAALFSLGAWPHPEHMRQRMMESPLFSRDLSGDYLAVEKAWSLSPHEPVVWRMAVIHQSADRVRRLLPRFPQCRLLIVNTPEECVIGGLEDSVTGFIRAASAPAVYLDGVAAVHCDVLRPVEAEYRTMHHFAETRPLDGIRFYSTAQARAIALTPDTAADAITGQALHGFDFPKTIQQAYADGVRVFIEMGPGNACTRMIRNILGDIPYLALSLSEKGIREPISVLRAMGNLLAAGIPYPKKAVSLASQPEPASPQSSHAQTLFGIMERVGRGIVETTTATAEAHELFLGLSESLTHSFASAFDLQTQLLTRSGHQSFLDPASPDATPPTVAFTRDQCLAFATGSVAAVLGPRFAVVDTYPARVRLPDEPLMFVDRIVSVSGTKGTLGPGSVVTEHDVRPEAWYLDGNRTPACVSVEAGQADLFLCAYLGIDLEVKGRRTYRLLDATVTFHRPLPRSGDTLCYEIHIDRFVRQGQTWLFFFRFEGSIDGKPLITMRDGCAGFFTPEEVENSGGILLTETEKTEMEQSPELSISPIPWAVDSSAPPQTYDDAKLDALRCGDLAACFGNRFSGIEISPGQWLPGGRMHLIDRILHLDLKGGRHGRGIIRAEADIRPAHWFLTCHFVDDKVMPGTLMYECCSHALRVFLQAIGWVTDHPDAGFEPVPGISAHLKCRGPVTPNTRKVVYEVEIRQLGYGPEPYAVADAHMVADGRYIVLFRNMSLRLTDTTREELEALWAKGSKKRAPSPIFDRHQLVSFSMGKPSDAFGPVYAPFDAGRFIARLPNPPYLFMDRVIKADCEPMRLKPDGWIESEYRYSADAWFFKANRAPVMPFAVLLEIALQPCGWLAAYMGSALRSSKDLHFRNLGGSAMVHHHLKPRATRLLTQARLTQVAEAGDMIIETFEFRVVRDKEIVYEGTTTFGFFTAEALSEQAGIRNPPQISNASDPTSDSAHGAISVPNLAPLHPGEPGPDTDDTVHTDRTFPAKALCMVDTIPWFSPQGGSKRLGDICGTKSMDPSEWFFSAPFYQDPVCPGSLGIESLLQILRAAAGEVWPSLRRTHAAAPLRHAAHDWTYRGQILRHNLQARVCAEIVRKDQMPAPILAANGFLEVDGLPIYDMRGFGIELIPVD